MSEGQNQKKIVANATSWSLVTQFIAKVIPPISSMILARVFAPEVFGVIATITMVTNFADIFSESGFQKYIIRNKYEDPLDLRKDADVAFWSHLGISMALWIVISIFGKPICVLLGNENISMALIVACAQLPITALSSIQTAVLQKEYNFKRVFYGQLLSSVGNLALTLVLALVGLGYWAVIFGNIFGYFVRAVALSVRSPWRPHLYYSFRRIRRIFSFSMWILIEAIAVWLTSWFDSFIIGNRMSDHNLGVYKNSQSVVNSLLSIPQYSITNVLLVTLSKNLHDKQAYNKAFFDSQRMLAFMLLPMGVGIFLYRELAVSLAFGPGWEDAQLVVGLWSLASILRILFVSLNSAVFVSQGQPKLSLYCQLIDMVILIPTCLIGVRYGLKTFVMIRCLVRLDIIIPNLYLLSRKFDIKTREIGRNMWKPAAATLIMAGAALLLQTVSDGIWWSLFSIAVCVVIYVSVVLIIAKEDARAIVNLLRRK